MPFHKERDHRVARGVYLDDLESTSDRVDEKEDVRKSHERFTLDSSPNADERPSSRQSFDKTYTGAAGAYRRSVQSFTSSPLTTSSSQDHEVVLDRLKMDLLTMTHKYVEAQAEANRLAAKYTEAMAQMESLKAQLRSATEVRETLAQNFNKLSVENRRLRLKQQERMPEPTSRLPTPPILPSGSASNSSPQSVKQSTPPQSASSTNTTSDLDHSAASGVVGTETEMASTDIVLLLKSINVKALEIARTCIGASTFKAGVKTLKVDNKMVMNVTEGIGYLMVQLLRTKDHSKDKAVVEVALQTILAYNIFNFIENKPFHLIESGTTPWKQQVASGPSHPPKKGSELAVEKTLDDIATILTLSGSMEGKTPIRQQCENSVGEILATMFKSIEVLESQIRSGSWSDYKMLCAKPGSAFNKDFMQRPGQMFWSNATKKAAQVLCTREIGLARVMRLANNVDLQPSSSKGIVVLIKAVVVFEADVNRDR